MKDFTILDLLDLDLKEHHLLDIKCIAGRSGLSKKIDKAMISRPGLPLSGYFENFNNRSIQLLGQGEQSYINSLEAKGDVASIVRIFEAGIPCCVFSNSGTPSEHTIRLAEENSVAILQTPLDSSDFSRRAFTALDEVFALTQTIHGVLVEVFGIGVLIRGEAGVGKSETALELIERSHRLVTDDTVKLKNLSNTFLVGSGENPALAHHMEIRGIGIINIATMYGVGAIRDKKQVQLSVHLENWDNSKNYDRVGEEKSTTTLLGVEIPHLDIPVKPGRNIPILIETAARNERLKKQGFHSAKEFDTNVQRWLETESTKKLYYNTDIKDDINDN